MRGNKQSLRTDAVHASTDEIQSCWIIKEPLSSNLREFINLFHRSYLNTASVFNTSALQHILIKTHSFVGLFVTEFKGLFPSQASCPSQVIIFYHSLARPPPFSLREEERNTILCIWFWFGSEGEISSKVNTLATSQGIYIDTGQEEEKKKYSPSVDTQLH